VISRRAFREVKVTGALDLPLKFDENLLFIQDFRLTL
jgi:hypothetical protein